MEYLHVVLTNQDGMELWRSAIPIAVCKCLAPNWRPRIRKYRAGSGHEAFFIELIIFSLPWCWGSRQYFSPIFLASTIIGGNFFPAVPRLLLSFSTFSNPPADGSAKTDGEAYFSCEAVPAGGRRMREATFRSPTRETPPERKEITFRNECSRYVRAREFLEGQVVVIRKRRREEGWKKENSRVEPNYSHDVYGYLGFAR